MQFYLSSKALQVVPLLKRVHYVDKVRMGAVQTLPESNHTPGKNICTWIEEKERKKGRREKERKAELVRNEKGKEKEKEGEWVEEKNRRQE